MKNKRISTARKLANSLYQKCNEGVSYNAQFNSPTWGYIVGLKNGPVFDTVTGVKTGEVIRFIEDNLPSMEFPLHYFGVWIDDDTRKVYFDLSEQFANRDKAIEAAIERNQIAIWDVENKKEIRIAPVANDSLADCSECGKTVPKDQLSANGLCPPCVEAWIK